MEETPLFSDFNDVSHNEWKNKILEDLKGKSFDETVVWKDESGIDHQPFYNQESISNQSLVNQIQVLQPKNNDWKIIQEIYLSKDESNDRLENINKDGVDEIVVYGAKSFKKGKKVNYFLNHTNFDTLPSQLLLDPIGESIKINDDFDSIENLIPIFKQKLNDLNLDGFLLVDGTIYKNAGATIIEELALTLHHAYEYLDKLTDFGFTPEAISRSFIFKLGFGTSYFSEIAKARAFRFLLHKLIVGYKTKINPTIWGEASLYYLAHKDAHTNLIRSTSQCMSAILGNCNYISTPSFDEHATASEMGMRMAKNIPLILREESFFNQVKDISAGSYYIEKLSTKIVKEAWSTFLEIEDEGGLIKIYKSGQLKRMLDHSHQTKVDNLSNQEKSMVGVNKYINPNGLNLNVSSNNSAGNGLKVLSKEIDQ